jgi:hypothetical protein
MVLLPKFDRLEAHGKKINGVELRRREIFRHLMLFIARVQVDNHTARRECRKAGAASTGLPKAPH